MKVQLGQSVDVHYKGTLDDGTVFDSSVDRGEALTCVVGSGQLISGFNDALVGMSVGESKVVNIDQGKAYGPVNPEAVQSVSKNLFPDDFEFKVGAFVHGQDVSGNQMMAEVKSCDEDSVTLDFNHPLAGQNLSFEIELVSIND